MELQLPAAMDVSKAANPLRLAVVTSRIPLPMVRADQITVAHWIAYLSARGHQVELFANTGRSEPDREAMVWLLRHCRGVHLFPRSRWRACAGAALAALRGRPMQVGFFDNPMQRRVLKQAASRFDAIYAYYIRSAEAVPKSVSAPTLLGMQLSQTLNIQRMLASFRPGWERFLYRVEAPLVRRYEARAWRRFDRTVLIGPADLAAVRQACETEGQPPIDNAVLVPHGTDIRNSRELDHKGDGKTVLFLGVMSTNTNVEGLLWFVSQCWPAIRTASPGTKLQIVGRRPRPEIQALHGAGGIEVVGEVEDPMPYLANAAVCISPVRAAAGMQNKLLDYFRAGKAVVATSVANEGIGSRPESEVLVADLPEAYAHDVLSLLENPDRRQRLGKAARRFVENGWGWESLFSILEQHVQATAAYGRLKATSPRTVPYGYPSDLGRQSAYSVAEPYVPWGEDRQ